MLDNYTTTNILIWIALLVLCVLVAQAHSIPQKNKPIWYASYAVIGLALFAEWLGNLINGNPAVPEFAFRVVKMCDYILTPIAGGAIAMQLGIRNNVTKALMATLAANTLFQITSLLTGWMVKVSPITHTYEHGDWYWVYVMIYVAVIILVAFHFLIYGRAFQYQNRHSLNAIMFMVVAGVLGQEILGGDVRIAYIALTLGSAYMFIHYVEFAKQIDDDKVSKLEIQVSTDALTGLHSRKAYSDDMERLYIDKLPPSKFAAFSIDINGLKEMNDSLGHDAGDELICGAAECIDSVFGGHAKCYRTGGDEFMVLGDMDKDTADALISELKAIVSDWHGTQAESLSLSAGYALACDFDGLTGDEVIRKSDLAMYADKADYYKNGGHERRLHYMA